MTAPARRRAADRPAADSSPDVDAYISRIVARLSETPLTPQQQDVIRAAFRGTMPSPRRRAAA